MRLRSGDAELFYEARGKGPALFLLHPFPTNHRFWNAIAPALADRYRLIIPDLRAHGASEPGPGLVTMGRHAADLDALCRANQIENGIFFGVSIGGYAMFELWRKRSEERRVGKECRSRWSPYPYKKKIIKRTAKCGTASAPATPWSTDTSVTRQ